MASIAELLAEGWKLQRVWESARAEQHAQQVLGLDANNSEARYLLAVSLHSRGRLEEAVQQYEQVLRERPNWAEVGNDLGTARAMQGRLEEAIAAFSRVLELKPHWADAHGNLANALRLQGRPAQALAHYESALRARPAHAETHYHFGLALAALGRKDEARARYEQATRLKPDFARAWNGLGNLLCAQGFLEEGIACHRKALAVSGDSGQGYSNLLLALHHRAPYDPQAIFEEHQRWGRRFTPMAAPVPENRDPHRRLRLGYVSGDFRFNVLGNYLEQVLAAHDGAAFEIFCYCNTSPTEALTERIKAGVDHWRTIRGLADTAVADQIRQDRIDILVDVAGHTAGSRLSVFALKPAPIQVTHFGYTCTSGLTAMDYRLSDAYSDPPGKTEHLHTEKLIRLPHAQWCFRPMTDTRPSMERAAQPGTLTFASFNRLGKITEELIGWWARILRALPAARLLLLAEEGQAAQDRLCAAFQSLGVERDRLVFLARQSTEAYYRTYQQIDICLDTYPFTGCFTTADALWMGVPVVSLAGPAWLSRQGVALLAQVGLDDLVVDSPQAYVATAVRLAGDPERLRELRGRLRDRLEQSPLMDVKGFTRNLEAAYRAMWEQYCRGSDTEPAPATPMPPAGRRQAEVLTARGNALRRQGDSVQGIACYRAALQQDPSCARAHFNLGQALGDQNRLDEAQACFEEAVRIEPNYAQALTGLGLLLCGQGFVKEGIACHRRAALARPDLPYIQSNLLYALHHLPDYDLQALAEEHRRWGRQFLPAAAPAPLNRDPNRRLRIGYVSADFVQSALGQCLAAVLAAHDHTAFEICCYANVARPDAVTERTRALADRWRSLHGLSDAPAADQIRADQIDLLVDLGGHTAHNRLGVFARKPAPLQVTLFGYCSTTGLAAVDYRLTDRHGDPPGQTERFHSEKLMRLPDVQWCYRPFTETRPDTKRSGNPRELTFASLNKLAKVTEERIGRWAEILQAIPGSRLILLAGGSEAGPERVWQTFARHGVARERITFVPRQLSLEYYQMYQRVDVCLDTFPFTGCFTTADALWMGVPVVSQAGPAWHSRQAVAILAQVGLEDLIVETAEAYVATVTSLARDAARRQTLRAQLRPRLEESPLMDVTGFTRNLEAAYRALWKQYCNEH